VNGHADLELIAAFREGLLDQASGQRVGRHLAGCAMCALRAVAITEVTARLAGEPVPPLPGHVASRLDAALAAEIAATTAGLAATAAGTGPSAGAGNSPGTGSAGRETFVAVPGARRKHAAGSRPPAAAPGGRRPGRRRRAGPDRAAHGLVAVLTRPMAAVAAVCLLAGGGYLLLRSGTPQYAGTASPAPGTAHAPRAAAGSALTPSKQNLAGAAPGANRAPSRASAVLMVQSGTRYLPASLSAQAAATLARYQGAIPTAGQAGIGAAQPFGSPDLLACLQQVAAGRVRLLVDTATYQGQPATVIIAPAAGGQRGHVWVVTPACGASPHEIVSSTAF
jgi:hypothetical protein